MTTQKKKTELRKMLLSWLENDLVKAGFVYNEVEKRNEAFVRGWRLAVYSIIQKLDDFNL